MGRRIGESPALYPFAGKELNVQITAYTYFLLPLRLKNHSKLRRDRRFVPTLGNNFLLGNFKPSQGFYNFPEFHRE